MAMISGSHIPTWCGLECTIVRVGDRSRSQFDETGHTRRGGDDIRRVAEIGFEAIRYPVHWEVVSPSVGSQRNWSWYDAQLAHIRATNMRVIAGLVHHGSGPRHTHLLDERFVFGLARHAGEVARRYPWIADYTPVNEPLTTARFAGLYGHWYPHGRAYPAFFRALVVQCAATRAAMKTIRTVRSDARLVQTEDLGRVFGRPALGHQVEHENLRRWLSLDLLCGRVDEAHPFWREMIDHGIQPGVLASFLDDPCPPDIIGINHYLSSDRFLDDRIDRYPAGDIGSNGRERYADVAAAMMRDVPSEDIGWLPRLREVWERYRLPIALTEVHNGCTREEQLRWVEEAATAAYTLQAEGVDIRAITAWSVYGAVDWASLLVREDGVYEPGLFDASATPPRKTALADEWRMISRPDFVLAQRHGPGWWRRNRQSETDGARAPTQTVAIIGDNAGARAMVEVAFRRGLQAIHLRDGDANLPDSLSRHRRVLGVVDCRPFRDTSAEARSSEKTGDTPLIAFVDCESDMMAAPAAGEAEMRLLARARVLVVRTPGPFWIESGDAAGLLLRRRQFADRVLDLLIDRAWGLWRVVAEAAHEGRASRGPLLSRVSATAAVDASALRSNPRRAGQ